MDVTIVKTTDGRQNLKAEFAIFGNLRDADDDPVWKTSHLSDVVIIYEYQNLDALCQPRNEHFYHADADD